MEITVQQYKHCDLVSIKGKVDSFTAPELSRVLEELNSQGRFKIVLNLSGVEYMSSAGLRALLLGQRACRRYNRGEIVLACVPPKVMDALELTGFTPMFKIFDNLTDAVGYF